MSKILLCAATAFEIAPILNKLKASSYSNIEACITGVGMTQTALSLGVAFAKCKYDFAIQLGIAGTYRTDWKLGKVVQVTNDFFADLGAEDKDGAFLPIKEMNLLSNPEYYDSEGRIWGNIPKSINLNFEKANGITVNKVHGSTQSIKKTKSQFPFAEIESMEGAAFFLACRQFDLPCIQLRAISNYVEPRNRDNWNIPLAIEELARAWEVLELGSIE